MLSAELWKNLRGETTQGWDLIYFIANSREIDLPFTATTTNIPAKLGVTFGIHYEVRNLPIKEGEMDLIRVTTYPALTNPDGRTSTSSEYPVRRTVHNGKIISESFYRFDNEWELVPGRWAIEIKFNGKSLCKQEFTVVRE